MARKLPGKAKKETREQRLARKKNTEEALQISKRFVLPSVAFGFLAFVLFFLNFIYLFIHNIVLKFLKFQHE